ncbi:MAG: UDP-N-acetylmuramate--L-alanine ligase, partial [Planctomycetota bacterium]
MTRRPQAQRFKGKHVHIIGIGGIGTSGIARMLASEGAVVTGSDQSGGEIVDALRDRGIAVAVGHHADNLPRVCDVVVYSAAIKSGNPELVEANHRGIEVMKYARMLGRLMTSRRGIAVAGTHGKTTTTSMIATILTTASLDPSYVVGGVVTGLAASSGVGEGDYFVAEACEYDRSFHELWPEIAVVLNVEEDHLDYYPGGLDEIVDSFDEFVGHVSPRGLVICNGQDAGVAKLSAMENTNVQTFGFSGEMDWQASDQEPLAGRYSFTVRRRGTELGRIALGVPGAHNVMNALAAVAVAMNLGVSWEVCVEALAGFEGVERRFQVVAESDDYVIVDDYAHHPSEIQVTLNAAREFFGPRKIWCIFQPHQHSRTRFLLNDFALSFGNADRVLVPDIYFVRDSEKERQAVSSRDLVDRISMHGGKALYLPTFDQIMVYLEENLLPGDVVITMGAGTINQIAWQLAERLGLGQTPAASRKPAAQRPRIAVAMGGPSSEHDVSLKSGQAVAAALTKGGYEVTEVVLETDDISELIDGRFDAVFVALHGEFGEDGKIQSLLEDYDIPYTGSRPSAASHAMDKYVSKATFAEKGIPSPPFVLLRGRGWARQVETFVERYGWPVVAKPVAQGSSIGVSICTDMAMLESAVKEITALPDRVLVERYVAGREFTVGVLGTRVLPAIELKTPHNFYDYEAKYIDHSTNYLFDIDLSEESLAEMQSVAMAAHRSLGCRDMSRVDLLMDDHYHFYVLEVNTIPGFTSTSLLPKAAARAGIDFVQLCTTLVEMALARRPEGKHTGPLAPG